MRGARAASLGALIVSLSALLVGVSGGAVADRPTAVPFEFVFPDVNPCSGLVHIVTISGTSWVHEHNGRIIFHSERTITTSSGFEGRGTDSFVNNGEIERFVLNDILTHESGERFRAHFGLVFDLSTGALITVIGGPLKCLGP